MKYDLLMLFVRMLLLNILLEDLLSDQLKDKNRQTVNF